MAAPIVEGALKPDELQACECVPDWLVSKVTHGMESNRQLLSPAPACIGPSVQVTPLASETDRKNGVLRSSVMVHFTDCSGHITVSEVTGRKRSIPKVILSGGRKAGTTVRVYGGVPLIPPVLASSIGSSSRSVQLAGQPQRENVLWVAEDIPFIPRTRAGGVKPRHV